MNFISVRYSTSPCSCFFFFNDTATTEIYTLSLHDALPIASAYAATQLCGRDRNARILFDGRRSGLAGAAFAGASTIDALDGHDGHVLTKGHAGAAILPALLALADTHPIGGREF